MRYSYKYYNMKAFNTKTYRLRGFKYIKYGCEIFNKYLQHIRINTLKNLKVSRGYLKFKECRYERIKAIKESLNNNEGSLLDKIDLEYLYEFEDLRDLGIRESLYIGVE